MSIFNNTILLFSLYHHHHHNHRRYHHHHHVCSELLFGSSCPCVSRAFSDLELLFVRVCFHDPPGQVICHLSFAFVVYLLFLASDFPIEVISLCHRRLLKYLNYLLRAFLTVPFLLFKCFLFEIYFLISVGGDAVRLVANKL